MFKPHRFAYIPLVSLIAIAGIFSGCTSSSKSERPVFNSSEISQYQDYKSMAREEQNAQSTKRRNELEARVSDFGDMQEFGVQVGQILSKYEHSIPSQQGNRQLTRISKSKNLDRDDFSQLEKLKAEIFGEFKGLEKYLPQGITIDDIDIKLSTQPVDSATLGLWRNSNSSHTLTAQVEGSGEFMLTYKSKDGAFPPVIAGTVSTLTNNTSMVYETPLNIMGQAYSVVLKLGRAITPTLATSP